MKFNPHISTSRPIFSLSLVSIVVMIVAFIFKLDVLPPQVPIYYSRPEGENQIADVVFIALIPLVQWVTVICNIIFCRKFFAETLFVRKIIDILNAIIIIISTYIFVRILFLIA